MRTYTAIVTLSAEAQDRVEQMLDVLDAAAMVGPTGGRVTLLFDVRAWTRRRALERAFMEAQGALGVDDVQFEVALASDVAGRRRS